MLAILNKIQLMMKIIFLLGNLKIDFNYSQQNKCYCLENEQENLLINKFQIVRKFIYLFWLRNSRTNKQKEKEQRISTNLTNFSWK